MNTHTATPSRTIELPTALGEGLERWSATSGHDQTPALIEAMTQFVARESAIVARIRKSIEQADRGEFASDEEVKTVFAKYGC